MGTHQDISNDLTAGREKEREREELMNERTSMGEMKIFRIQRE